MRKSTRQCPPVNFLTYLLSIPDTAAGRYSAHIVVVYLSTCEFPRSCCHSFTVTLTLLVWTLFLVRRELAHYTLKRHEFLTSSSHATLAQARTVLITNIPLPMCDEHELRRWASFVPGGVQNIWIYRDTKVSRVFPSPHEFAMSKLMELIRPLTMIITTALTPVSYWRRLLQGSYERSSGRNRKRTTLNRSGGGRRVFPLPRERRQKRRSPSNRTRCRSAVPSETSQTQLIGRPALTLGR